MKQTSRALFVLKCLCLFFLMKPAAGQKGIISSTNSAQSDILTNVAEFLYISSVLEYNFTASLTLLKWSVYYT